MNRILARHALRISRPAASVWKQQSSWKSGCVPVPTSTIALQRNFLRGFASSPSPGNDFPPQPTSSNQSTPSPTSDNPPPGTDVLSGEAKHLPVESAGHDAILAGSEASATVSANTSASVAETASETAVAVGAGTGDAPMTWGEFFLQPAMSFITTVHDATGLPWWGAIAVATLTIRTLILPVSIYTMRNASKMSAIQDDLKEMREDIMQAVRAGNRSLAEKKQEAQREFLRAAGVSPANVLLGPLSQFPVFISFFIGIRKIAEQNPDLTTGGIAWFTDLSSKDPTYGLPILAGLSLLAMTELGGDTGTKMTPQMKLMMRSMAVLSVPMTGWLPSAVFCYWIPNNIFSVCLGGAMRSPGMKNMFGLNIKAESIPGTKAALRAGRVEGGAARAVHVNPTDAAASYMRRRVAQPSNAAISSAKPVLHKTKPSKSKKKQGEKEDIAA